MSERIPPHNLDAESSVLGSCLLSQDAVIQAMDKLTPGDFYLAANGTIFATIMDLVNTNKPVDMVTVTQALQGAGKLQQIGGAMYIASLAGMVPSAASMEHYAAIVAQCALKRRIILAATKIASKGYDAADAEEYRSLAESELFAATGEVSQGGPLSVGKILLGGVMSEILEPKPPEDKSEVLTPWRAVNNLIPGLEPGDMITVAGRPSMGKTAFALQVADFAAVNHGPVAFFSLEMSKKQIVTRLLSSRAKVSGHLLRTKLLKGDEPARLTKAGGAMYKIPLFVDDAEGLSASQIRSRAQRIKAQHGLALIVIDYIGMMRGSGENRNQEISGISRGIKSMAKALEVPVVALSQLNREVEKRTIKRPQMSDLRESGSIEQDSDVIIFLYRDEYYNSESEKRGIAEIIVAKQRNGPTGTAELAWISEFTRFDSLFKTQ